MTRLAILSDVHGNLPALEAVMHDLSQFRVDQVIVAGDLVNVGPFSEQVVERIVESGWVVIRGNGELFLLHYGTPRAPDRWNDPTEFAMLPWLAHQASDTWKQVIATWPDTLTLRCRDAPPVCVVHGSPRSVTEGILSTTSEEKIQVYLTGVDEGIVVTGHTHLPLDRVSGCWHILNPGAVGLPRDGLLTASYMLLDGDAGGWRSTFRRVPFDYGPIFQEYERQRFVEECGVIGHLCVEAFRTARPQHSFLRWRRDHCPNEPASEEMYEEFRAECGWWEYVDVAYHVNM